MDMVAAGALLEPRVQGDQISADNLDLASIGDIFIPTLRAGWRPWMAGKAFRALPGLDRILCLGFLLALFRPIERPVPDVLRQTMPGEIPGVIQDDRSILARRWSQHASNLLQMQS